MSQSLTIEVLGKFEEAHDCAGLLYEPPESKLTFRSTRVYELEFEGDPAGATGFVEKVLVDAVGDESRSDGAPLLEGYSFYLEYWMKPGVLDLEQKAILDYAASHRELPVKVTGLRIRHRIYVMGAGGKSDDFVRDICNPAIHTWQVTAAS